MDLLKRIYYLLRHYTLWNRATHFFRGKKLAPFILCYHQINEDEFRAQLKVLKQKFEIVDLSTFIENLSQEFTRPYVTITLDDCIREDVEKALHIIEEERVPITCYLPSDYADTNRSLWHNKVNFILSDASQVRFESRPYDISSASGKRKVKKIIFNELLSANPQTYQLEERVNNWLKENDFAEKDIPKRVRVLGMDEVATYSKSSYISFQSHSSSHSFLNLLNSDEIDEQLKSSKDRIEAVTHQKVSSFCYPYGSVEAIGTIAPKIVADHYDHAVTLSQGVCKKGTDLYLLPRIGIYPGDGIPALLGKIYHYQNKSQLS